MPEVNISVDEEQRLFDAEVAAIEKQWASPRQAHLKR
jgi:isocitrate lyase